MVDNVKESGVIMDMVRNKKFLAYKADAKFHATWSGKNDEIPSPTVIWAKDLKDAQNILHGGYHNLIDYVIVEAKDD